MSPRSRDPPGQIPGSRFPSLLLLGIILCAAITAQVCAAPVIQKMPPVPNVTVTVQPLVSLAKTPVVEITTLVPLQPTHTTTTASPARTLRPFQTQTPDVARTRTTGTPGPDPDDVYGQIEHVPAPTELPDDILHEGNLDYGTVRSSDGDILDETASNHEEVIPIGNENDEGGAAGEDIPIAGFFLLGEAGRQEALAMLVEEDPTIKNLRGDENSVSVEYERHTKIFGIFSTPYTKTITVDRQGNISVDDPWWLVFAVKEEPGDLNNLDQIDLQDAQQEQQQFLQTISNIMKMQNDTMKAIINNTRG